MKEMITSGPRQITLKLDDEDYDKIMELPVQLVYTQHAQNGAHNPYVLPEGYGQKKKFLSAFIYDMKKGEKLVFADGDRYNFQNENVRAVSVAFKELTEEEKKQREERRKEKRVEYEKKRSQRYEYRERKDNYREAHREEINARHREYQRERAKIIVECECGESYSKKYKYRHVKSEQHLKYLNP
ncbi:MAG TPA: hypothetical protein PLS50_07855 [Candidatus Dojkabacteria bacterium]|nr:hypothetical protein [Candidatus Dojkabacteria bacterium]